MNKLEALRYLIDNESYTDEWSGAGMYHAVREVVDSKDDSFDEEFLNELLENAENF